MLTCVVVPVCVENRPGFMWRWRALAGKEESQFCFDLFYDCVEAARRRGYTLDMRATLEQSRRPETVSLEQYRRAPVPGA